MLENVSDGGLFFVFSFWNCTLALHIKLEQVLRPIDLLNRSRHVRNSTIKYTVNSFFSRRLPWRRRRRCLRSLFTTVTGEKHVASMFISQCLRKLLEDLKGRGCLGSVQELSRAETPWRATQLVPAG